MPPVPSSPPAWRGERLHTGLHAFECGLDTGNNTVGWCGGPALESLRHGPLAGEPGPVAGYEFLQFSTQFIGAELRPGKVREPEHRRIHVSVGFDVAETCCGMTWPAR